MALQTYTGSDEARTVLLTNVLGMFTELYTYVAEIVAARDGKTTLLAQIDELQAGILAVTTEVTNARDGEASLLAQIDILQAGIATLLVGTGCPVSVTDTTPGFLDGKLVAGDGIVLTKGNTGGNETLTVETDIVPTGAEWTSGSTYPAGAIVTDPADNYTAYTSQQAGNTGNPPNTDDGTWWEPTFEKDWELNTTKTVAFDIPTATDITETWVDITTTDTVATQVTVFGTNIDGEETITQTLVKDGVTTETVATFKTDGSIVIVKTEVV